MSATADPNEPPDARREPAGENDVEENSGVEGDAGNIDELRVPEATD